MAGYGLAPGDQALLLNHMIILELAKVPPRLPPPLFEMELTNQNLQSLIAGSCCKIPRGMHLMESITSEMESIRPSEGGESGFPHATP